jgi:hypothetical protein
VPVARSIAEGPVWLRPYVSPTPKSNQQFWQDAAGWAGADPPTKVKQALMGSLPDGAHGPRFGTRSKGGGSLGRPRFLVIATWNGGQVVREAKALVPSAWDWAHGANGPSRLLDAAFGTYRSADPRLRIEAGFIVRRVAPDSRKIDVSDLQTHGLTADLLVAMGADLAAVHVASKDAVAIGSDLQARPKGWLEEATQIATDATKRDFAAWVAATK